MRLSPVHPRAITNGSSKTPMSYYSSCKLVCKCFTNTFISFKSVDNAQEAEAVKKALQDHLDMDPDITLLVLCEQISPTDEPMNSEEDDTRNNLRSLVLSFLCLEAKKALITRHALPGSQGEKILFDALLSVSALFLFNKPSP